MPLALGADFVVASASKYLTGHSDLMLGYVACTHPELAQDLREWRTLSGAVAGPFEAWLAHRSLATLALRLERQAANALAMADFLAQHPQVQRVRYPGRANDPAHARAASMLSYFGSVVNFELESKCQAQHLLQSLEVIHEATSFGGVHSTAERTKRWGHDDIPDGFIRLSLGCEDGNDLIDDLAQALDRVALRRVPSV
jgi:cystathionine gamma-lyase